MNLIDKLKEVYSETTQQEWKHLPPGERDEEGSRRAFGAVIPAEHRIIIAEGLTLNEAIANTEFIALAHKAMPTLLEAVETLRKIEMATDHDPGIRAEVRWELAYDFLKKHHCF